MKKTEQTMHVIVITYTVENIIIKSASCKFTSLIALLLFALIYLRTDSTTVTLADAKLSGPRDAFKERFPYSVFFEFIEKRRHNMESCYDLF